jgi:hypothetical protein
MGEGQLREAKQGEGRVTPLRNVVALRVFGFVQPIVI